MNRAVSLWTLELALLLRDRAAAIILIGWITVLAYAGISGSHAVRSLQLDQMQFLQTAQQAQAEQRARIAAVETGTAPSDPYLGFPSTLRSPVAMPVSGVAALDLGVLDRINLNLQVSLFSGPQQAAKGRELQSPLLLSSGRFDLGFVAIVLMPLALIALLFAQPSDDRAEGRLPLLAAARSLSTLMWARYTLRVLAVLLPLLLISATTVLIADGALVDWLLWAVPMSGWALLWSGVSALLTSRSTSASSALAWLVAVWVGALWLLPGAVDALASRLAPTPSALSLLGEQRATDRRAQRAREALLGAYISDHPELSVKTEADALAWTRSYFVQQRYTTQAMTEAEATAHKRTFAHRTLRGRLIWLSPAQALSAASEHIASADLASATRFSTAAKAHKQAWDQALVRPLMAGTTLSSAELDRLPKFSAPTPERGWVSPFTLGLLLSVMGALLWKSARWRVLASTN